MPHAVYVWQREWGDPVRRAVAERASQFDAVVALAAEIGWKDGRMETVDVAWNADALHAVGAPVGLALRIGPCSKVLMRDPSSLSAIVHHAQRIVGSANQQGIALAELQLDFDCATSRLDGYADWVRAVSAAIAPVPLTITVLPTWMESGRFGPLVRETAGFVLQVHSVDKARMEDATPSLCDERLARRWIEQAARFGVPFRVALPTYGYLAVLDDRGSLRALVAESPVVPAAVATRVRHVHADPDAMAMLVRDLGTSRPALLRGVIWYRLPVDGDQLNWSWPTLQRVARGERPQPALRVSPERDGRGLVELEARNDGDADAALPGAVIVRWTGAAGLLAVDALRGMQAERGVCTVTFRLADDAGSPSLRPGERRKLGWLRLEHDMEVAIDVQ